MASVFDVVRWVERAGVEFLVEKLPSLVSDTVETSREPLDEPIPAHLGKSVASVVGDGDVELLERAWGHVTLLAHGLEDLLVDLRHPVRSLPWHISRCGCAIHSGVGIVTITVRKLVATGNGKSIAVESTVSYI